ncbi:MAG: hypothetical protein Q8941_17740 [Bacteroidota bacterium]|nr:hypothetical protein [Bacteroidota bacterium]
MRFLLHPLFLLTILAGQAQQTKVVDVNKDNVQIVGSLYYMVGDAPVSAAKYVKVVAGTPYFSESWMKAKLELEKGSVYQQVLVRLDLLANDLQYIGPGGKELVATTPVKSVTLLDSVSGKEYKFVHSSFLRLSKDMEAGWYLQLTTGTAVLYKKIRKMITEDKPYGSATVEQSISTAGQYFVEINAAFNRVKKFKELPDLLKDKKDELNKYISERNLSGKNDEDYIDLVTHYNDLLVKSNSMAVIQ